MDKKVIYIILIIVLSIVICAFIYLVITAYNLAKLYKSTTSFASHYSVVPVEDATLSTTSKYQLVRNYKYKYNGTIFTTKIIEKDIPLAEGDAAYAKYAGSETISDNLLADATIYFQPTNLTEVTDSIPIKNLTMFFFLIPVCLIIDIGLIISIV